MSQALYWRILFVGELYLEWRSCNITQPWYISHKRRQQIFFCFGQLCGVFWPYWSMR